VKRVPKPHVFWRSGGRGPALLLLNGWSASGLAWPRTWLRELERDFRVIRVDNRGSGYSRFAPTPFTMTELADDVADVLDAADVDRAIVLGMSMGGMIAQEVAFRHSERLSGLVLTATRPGAPVYSAPKQSGMMLDFLGPRRAGESLEVYLNRLWTSAAAEGFAAAHPEAIAELVEQVVERPTPRQMLLHQLRAVSGWGHAERLREIQIPTVVVHGAQDRLVHVLNGRRLGEMIPTATYVELEGVGHLPPLEAPEALLQAIATVAGSEREAPRNGRSAAAA
jgi:pimeloyl-ACP methyl ester carboxylesterase